MRKGREDYGGMSKKKKSKGRQEEEREVGNKTKRLFRFSRILRFYICSLSGSDSCYITGKDC